jgi:predicted acyl esterase
MHPTKSEIRDGMRIDWDAPIEMDDGVLRADVFRPLAEGKYPHLAAAPMPRGSRSRRYKAPGCATRDYPETAQGSSNKYQNWS